MPTPTFTSAHTVRYLVLLALLGLFIVSAQLWQNWWQLLLVIMAYAVGVALLELDERYLYRYYQEADATVVSLATRGTLFLLVLPLLSIFVLTSTGSWFGGAMVLAINSYLCLEMWQLYQEPILFKERFLSTWQNQFSTRQIQKFCLLVSVYTIGLWLINFL
jgi:hypothetical protein